MSEFFVGVVEDRQDPLRLGRCRVRVSGLHTANKADIPTSDLPWAWPIQDVTSAALSGIGRSATGLVEGSTVVVYFADEHQQIPMILGSLAAIPGSSEIEETVDDPIKDKLTITPPKSAPEPITIDGNSIEQPYVGTLTNSQLTSLKNKLKELPAKTGTVTQYKLNAQHLEAIGYVKPGSYSKADDKTTVLDGDVWTGKDGVTSKQLFESRTDLHDAAVDSTIKKNYTVLAQCDILSTSTPQEKSAGVLLTSLYNGLDETKNYIQRGVGDSSIQETYNLGYSTVLPMGTNEVPTIDNINLPAIDKDRPTSLNSKYDVVSSGGKDLTGFKDPNGRYPLASHLNEPDTPRVASVQKITMSIVGEKDADRTRYIPVANSSVNWSQSPIPYNAKYPYNHAWVSEAGHVLEFDDSRGRERVNIHHCSGTFLEVDSEGNQTNKVKGIRTIIVEEDDLVYIKGSGHVNVDGDLSIRASGQCQIEVMGNANLKVHGNFNQEVLGNYTINVHGQYAVAANGIHLNSASTMNINSSGASVLKGATWSLTAGNWVKGVDSLDGHPYVDGTVTTGGGDVVAITSLDPYTPIIKEPAPFTRDDEVAVLLEDEGNEDITAAESTSDIPQTVVLDQTPTTPKSVAVGICGFTSLSYDTQISVNYTLKDLCDSTFAFDGQNGLKGEEIACNLKQLAINIIEPLRVKYANEGFKINSCFRMRRNGKSQHEIGCAVDIGFSRIRGKSNQREEYLRIAKEIRDTVPFDQLLFETRSGGSIWLHISFNPNGNRNQILSLHNDKIIGIGLPVA